MTVLLPYRADRSGKNLLIPGLVHRTEYDDKTKELSPCMNAEDDSHRVCDFYGSYHREMVRD